MRLPSLIFKSETELRDLLANPKLTEGQQAKVHTMLFRTVFDSGLTVADLPVGTTVRVISRGGVVAKVEEISTVKEGAQAGQQYLVLNDGGSGGFFNYPHQCEVVTDPSETYSEQDRVAAFQGASSAA